MKLCPLLNLFPIAMGMSVWGLNSQVPATDWALESDDYVMANMNITYWDEHNMISITERGELAKFSSGKIDVVEGKLVHIVSNGTDYGCEKQFRDPPRNVNWIALVRRGKCYFDEKVEAAFASNASAIIVYNNRDDGLQKMTLKTKHRDKIVSVFMSRARGEELARLLDNGTQIYIAISIGTKYSYKFATINRTSVMFVSISFIVLMMISLAWLIFYYVQRFRYLHARDQLTRQLSNAAQKALSKVPTKTMKSADAESGEAECCAVCIEPFKNNEVLRQLPCRHEYHKNCIDPWLLEHRTCPMCKMDILKHYGYIFSGSQESILNMDLDTPMVTTRGGRLSGENGSLTPERFSLPATPEPQHVPIPVPTTSGRRLRLPVTAEGRWTWGRGFIWGRQDGAASNSEVTQGQSSEEQCRRVSAPVSRPVRPFSPTNLVIPTISVIDTSCQPTDAVAVPPVIDPSPSLHPLSKSVAIRTL